MHESCSYFPAPAESVPVADVAEHVRPVLPGGGVMAGQLHEVFAAEPCDSAAAAGYALLMALSVLPPHAPLLWLRLAKVEQASGLYAPGLAALGLDPAQVIMGRLPNALALLRAGVDALRCSGLGAVIMDLPGRVRELDLTATRRMTLAAEASGVTPILLRTNAQPTPSAAHSRWSVESAPSRAFPANAPGHPAFTFTLLRRRGGAAGMNWQMEWDRDTRSFCPLEPAPLSGAALPLAVGGSLASGTGRRHFF